MNSDNCIKQSIRELLQTHGMSVNSLARLSGQSQKTLNDQINGNIKVGMPVIIALTTAIPSVSLEWLLRGEGEIYRSGSKDIVINNTNSHHNISGSGTLTQNNNSGDTEFLKKVIADKDAQIAELKKDKELLGNLLQALTKR